MHNWWRRSGQQVSISPQGKTEEEKERGISQPLIHQEKGQTRALHHFTYFYILKVKPKVD